jgi:hypothetical protein
MAGDSVCAGPHFVKRCVTAGRNSLNGWDKAADEAGRAAESGREAACFIKQAAQPVRGREMKVTALYFL